MSRFPYDEFYEICDDLATFDEIFSGIWKISRPRFSDQVPTAAVAFDKAGGCIDFMFNEKHWNSIDDYTKRFVICHEMTHVINLHGLRSIPFRERYTPDTINIALDLATNHILTKNFGFNRFWIQDWQELCWCDTVFKELDLEPNKAFEYYIMKVQENLQKFKVTIKICDHSNLNGFDQQANSAIQRSLNEVLGKIDPNAKDKIDKSIDDLLKRYSSGGAGLDEGSSFSTFMGRDIVVKKIREWDSILKTYMFKTEKEKEAMQWLRANRRMTMMGADIILPSENETIERDFFKYNVDLFLDYSGSCSHLQDLFFGASKTFDPRKFNVRKFAHTTQVGEFHGDEVKVYGGGTDFNCIETFLQQQKAEGKIAKYPDCIMHFTDGQSFRHFTVEKPERWYVFLTDRGYKQYYPQGVNFFKLRDFVADYNDRGY